MKVHLLGTMVGFSLAVTPLALSGQANADAGPSYEYRCSRINATTSDDYLIAFADIYKCSNGPMDGPSIINQISRYTGKRVAWIDGECAWYGYHKKGWRDRTRIWNWCLTRPRLQY